MVAIFETFLVCRAPFCCDFADEEQTKASKILRISTIALGIIAAIVGILIIKNVIGLGLLSTAIGAPVIACGLVIILAALFLRCIKRVPIGNVTIINPLPVPSLIPPENNPVFIAGLGKLTFLKDAMVNKEWHLIENELPNLTPLEEEFVFENAILFGKAHIIQPILAKDPSKAFKAISHSGKECYPLFKAISHWNKEKALEMIKVILSYDHEKVLVKNLHGGTTALHNAVVASESIAIVKFLLNNDANVNAQDSLGNTPLHCLTNIMLKDSEDDIKILLGFDDEIQIFQLLVDSGANLHLANNQGITVFDLIKDKELFSQIKLKISE